MRRSRRPARRCSAGAICHGVINFLILAFIIFLLVRWAGKVMRRRDEATGPTEVELLSEIRDELRRR